MSMWEINCEKVHWKVLWTEETAMHQDWEEHGWSCRHLGKCLGGWKQYLPPPEERYQGQAMRIDQYPTWEKHLRGFDLMVMEGGTGYNLGLNYWMKLFIILFRSALSLQIPSGGYSLQRSKEKENFSRHLYLLIFNMGNILTYEMKNEIFFHYLS